MMFQQRQEETLAVQWTGTNPDEIREFFSQLKWVAGADFFFQPPWIIITASPSGREATRVPLNCWIVQRPSGDVEWLTDTKFQMIYEKKERKTSRKKTTGRQKFT